MLALRIDYLTGRCVATSYNDRSSVEWPPHPARVFFAFVSAWGESIEMADTERAALEWLAAQPPPSLTADLSPAGRSVVTHYVPVNDTSVLATAFSVDGKLTRARTEEEELVKGVAAATDAKGERQAQTKLDKKRAQIVKMAAELAAAKLADQSDLFAASSAVENRAVGLLPERRVRQPRTFPSRALPESTVHVVWDGTAPPEVAGAIDRIARRVTRIGHSSSLVACRLVAEPVQPTLVPRDGGQYMLRVPTPGLVERLVAAHARHLQIAPRVMPCAFQAYARVQEVTPPPLAASVFGEDWLVFRQVGGPRLSSTLVVEVASAVRGALMSHADQPVPEMLSGHLPDGTPSREPHAAIVPLSWVGHPQATGGILGVALVLPRELHGEGRRAVLRAVGRWESEMRRATDDAEVDAPTLALRLGSRGVLEVERVVWGVAPQATLRASTWSRPSRQWLSVTPVALDRNPGNLHAPDPAVAAQAYLQAAETIATSCERVGLPRPARVDVLPSVTMAGVAKARAYPTFPSDSRKPQRVKVHALLEFEAPVRGPLLLGAGRFLGLGLFRPVDEPIIGGAQS